VDWFGLLAFVGALAGVAAHGGLRFFSSLRLPRHTAELRQVYVYTVYERFWHWLQTFTIVGLIFTGLIIHKPAIFGIFAFRSVVYVHNVLAAIVIINAALSLFYHLASGEVKQFLPRPQGLFDRLIVQAKYYLWGIFKNEPHPFEKTPQRKLNPLQQITYFGLLNVLLPSQIITGALIWGAQHWPNVAQRVGGLPLLAPAHSLIAWLLAAFVVMHVYLTTTGHTPLALIQAMMLGWETVEAHESHPQVPAAPIGRGEVLKPAQETSHDS
jgi:thiosulfate reductase cytochrome b subunit